MSGDPVSGTATVEFDLAADLDALIKTVHQFHPKSDAAVIRRAFETAAKFHEGQSRRSGEPYITHPLAVAGILADLGMYLQTFMLLAVERGLATCPQEYWSLRPRTVAGFVGAPENEMLFCGVALGREDASAPVNSLVSERMPLEQWAMFL